MAIHFQRGEELEHLLDFLDLGFLIDGGVGGHLVAENFGHAHGCDAFLEDAFALDDQIVGVFQAVDVDVPVHPFGGPDDGAAVGFPFADGLGILFGNKFLLEQLGQGRLRSGL